MDRYIQSILVFTFSQLVLGCGEGGGSSAGTSNGDRIGTNDGHLASMALSVNSYPMNQLVCDPFEYHEDPHLSFSNGLKAELYFVDDTSRVSDSVEDYIKSGKKSDFHIFFNSLIIHTQNFVDGFVYETGGLVHGQFNEIIHDHFALKIEGNLRLSEEQGEGDYEFSLLSDDGAIFKIYYDGEWLEVINNDGSHPTLYSCSESILKLEKGVKYPIEIQYLQSTKGSPIALVPLWRRVRANRMLDPFCSLGQGVRNRYFDINNHSLPLPAYRALTARSWRPIAAENLFLPDSEGFNPCVDTKQVPKISGFQFRFQKNSIIAEWETDIPSTSQLIYTKSSTGTETLTLSDDRLRKKHSVKIPRNPAGVSYIVRAVSVSETFGRAVSGGYTIHGFR